MTRNSESTADGNWYVLIAGMVPPSEPVTLAPGMSLLPLESPLTVFDLAAAGAVGFRKWSVLEPVAGNCACEIESAKDSDVTPGYDMLHRAWLASALMVLRGFTRHTCVACSAYSWGTIAGHQDRTADVFRQQMGEDGVEAAVFKSKRNLPPFKGDLLDFHLQIMVDDAFRTDGVQTQDADWIREHFNTFNMLAAQSGPFRFALEASVDWRYGRDPRAAISRLWAGIEALFGISSELVYRISLLSACLLAPRGNARRDKFLQVKKLYALRSKAVHGVSLPKTKIQEALTGSYSLLRDLLLLCIERGHALGEEDFDEAVFY